MRYDISIDSELPHLFSIRVYISRPLGRFSLKLPKWRPGRYSYADYAAFVNDFEVLDAQEGMRIERVDPYEWEVGSSH
jgi:predicted metalloprotease with PDZ domain